MKNALRYALAVVSFCSYNVYADVTLTFELKGPDTEAHNKTISISRFFARIDDPAEPDTYLIYQSGKFFPLYRVDKAARTYTRLTPEVRPTLHAGIKPQADSNQPEPEGKTGETTGIGGNQANESTAMATPSDTFIGLPTAEKTQDIAPKASAEKLNTSLRPTKNTKIYAGVTCRVVEELAGNQPVMTHCMADKTRLGISERETRSLARVFSMARDRGFGWLGTTTNDERFVSVASKDLQSNKTLQLKSRSANPLPAGYLRIPNNFKQFQSE